MILADVEERMPKKGDYIVDLIGDTQAGNIAMSDEKVHKAIELNKKEKLAFIITTGDMTESIHIGDKRYDSAVHEGKYATANKQTSHLAAIFEPVKDRIVCAYPGNHERTLKNICDITSMWMEKLLGPDHKVPCTGGVSAKIRFSDTFRFFGHHGSGSINSKAKDAKTRYDNMCNALKNKLKLIFSDCNVMAMSHIHKLLLRKPIHMTVREMHLIGDDKIHNVYRTPTVTDYGVVPEDDRFYCATGSFLRTLVPGIITYTEQAMYPPVEIGFIRLTVRNHICVDAEEIIL